MSFTVAGGNHKSARSPGSGVVAALVVLTALLISVTQAVPASSPAGSTGGQPGPGAPPGITLAGDASVAGTLRLSRIECGLPTLTGGEIYLRGKAGQADAVITVRQRDVVVQLSTGSGATFAQRTFGGRLTQTVDPNRGGSLAVQLTESVPPTRIASASLGALTALSGSISCTGATAGSASIAISGATADGPLTGSLQNAHVACAGGQATITGLMSAPGLALISIQVAPPGFSVSQSDEVGGGGFYVSPGGGTVTGSAVSVSGAATEAYGTHVLRVTGTAVCGTDPALPQ